jgi:hypothetical protein
VHGPHRSCSYEETFQAVLVDTPPRRQAAWVSALLDADASAFRDGLRAELARACEDGIDAEVRPELDVHCEVPFASRRLVSVACEGYLYVGGAHGMKSSWTTNVVRGSRRALRLKDLFRARSRWRAKLDRLAAGAFARAVGSDEVDPMHERIPEGGSFVVTRGGLRFYLENEDPYVTGSVHPLVAWSALRAVLRPSQRRMFVRNATSRRAMEPRARRP